MGPSTSERSYLEGFTAETVAMRSIARVYYTMRAVLFLIVLVFLSTSEMAWADGGNDRLCGVWAINAWGLSYHVKENGNYSDANLGAGGRCYARPHWRGFGSNRDNRLLLEVDALRNSHKGLIVPASAGAEFKLAAFHETCGVFAIGALTFAYYNNPDRKADYIKWGPVPGVAVGCGRLRPNVIFVPSHSRQVIAVITASMTFVFK
jgi:hypothetical protein